MNDRELLELVAKALGARFRGGESKYIRGTIWGLDGDNFPVEWNPLTDDGDALRLAVKLNLCPKRFGDLIEVVAPKGNSFAIVCEQGVVGGDLMVAYRRAIVRAAAEIGRSIP